MMGDYKQNLIDKLEKAKQYWLRKLSGKIERVELASNYLESDTCKKSELKIIIPKAISKKITLISKGQDLASYVILLAAFKVVTYKYTGQKDIITASPPLSSGGQSFNKILAIRDQIEENMTFKEVLIKVKQTVSEAYKNQHYPMDKLLKLLGYDDMELLTGIIVMMDGIHENIPLDSNASFANRDLIVRIGKANDSFECNVQYNPELFSLYAVKKIFECYNNILSCVLANLDIEISNIELVSQDEKNKLLMEFNNTIQDYPYDRTIHELFEIQAEETPENIAVSSAINLTEVYDTLRSEVTVPKTMEKISKCCFKENPYIFRCSIDVPGHEGKFTLLKTHTHKNIVVNNNVLKIMQLFNKNLNVKSLFNKVKNHSFNLIIYSIPHDDVLEISIKLDNTKLETFKTNSEDDFCRFIKLLYCNDIIQLIDFKSIEVDERFEPEVNFEIHQQNLEKEKLDYMFLPDKNLQKAEVLLFGDTPGMSTVGLLYLASYLRRNGYSAYCQFTDSNIEYNEFKKNIEELIDKIQPRIIGVSMKWFVHSSRALETCKIVKQYCPDIKVVVGGNTASYYYDRVIQYDYVDYVIRGDGELPFLKICQAADYIPNCCYKRDGQIIDNPITYVQDELNSKDIYLSNLDEILISKRATLFGTFFIYTSKGCGLNCLTCASCREGMAKTFNRTKLNMRGIDEIRNDIMLTKNYVSTFMFDFESSNKNLLKLCRDMWEGIDLSSHFCTFCNVIPPSKELLEYVNKTFKYVYWELDICSLSERHRKHLESSKEIKPQPTDKEIFNFMDECEKYKNSEVRINLIAGMPFYTEEDMKESDRILDYIMNTYSCFSNLHWARLHAQPGAPVAHNAEKYDMVSYGETFEDYIKFSNKNMESRPFYPHLEDLFYPYIYYKDEELNSKVSQHYLATNKKIESFIRSKKDNLMVSESLTYKELDRKSNQVANYLIKKYNKSNKIVGILLNYSTDLIVGILGVLKSGGAYLPISPDCPDERIRLILKESKVDIVLTQLDLMKKINFSGQVIDIGDESIVRGYGRKLGKTSSAQDLAYVIYTSGSTGVPKGVMVEHKSLVNFIYWRKQKYDFQPEDRTLQLISPAFDGFGANCYSSILSGGSLILPDAKRWRDFDFARRLIKEMQITNMSVVPSMYRAILDGAVPKDIEALKFVVLAGEKADKDLVLLSKQIKPSIRLINEYGPTENTITTTSLIDMEADQTSIIGSPIANNRLYVLNKQGSLLPIGVQGDLYIAGEGLARGYLNNPELNGEKFIRDPFYKCQRMYKTGDIARWMQDGNVELYGRADRQVKIRGYRIELGEIESKLIEIDAVKEVAVVLKKDKNQNNVICTYIVSSEGIEEKELREYIMKYLPDYMVPSVFVFLDKMPLTNNGKLDRKALEVLEIKSTAKIEYEAPRNEVEEKIAAVWQEILGIEKIGINDNFFTSGGDSIKAIQISAKLQKQMIKVDVKDIFKYTTIKQLSPHVKHVSLIKVNNDIVQGETELSPIQKWFFEKKMKNRNHFNQAVMLHAKEGFNQDIIRNAFTKIVEKHDALRMVYRNVRGKIQQYNKGLDEELFILEEVDLTKNDNYREAITVEVERLQRSLDLEKGPLVKLGLFKTIHGDHLLVIIHHLVVDGVSWRIILNDFSIIYNAMMSGEEVVTSNKSLSYKDWVEEINKYANSKRLLKEINYWNSLEKQKLDFLPRDMEPESNKLEDEMVLGFELDEIETENLLKGVNRPYNTEINDILIAALGLSIREWTGSTKVAISLEGHGREQIIDYIDINETVGWFTSQYPVVINMSSMDDIPMTIKTVKETLRKVPNKGIGYGILRYITDTENIKNVEFNLKPQIGFNYLGQFDQDINSKYFTFSDIATGTSISPEMDRINDLEIIGLIVEKKLKINFHYCNNQYMETTIREILNKYKKNLRNIITHCISTTECELTPSDVGDSTLTQRELDTIIETIDKEIIKVYPLSPMQEGMLYHTLTRNGIDVYFEQSIMTVKGEFDVDIYEKSYNMIFDRYEILRTAFVFKNIQKPRQIVLKERKHEVYIEDISSMDKEKRNLYISSYIKKDRERGFDLTEDALIRTSIFKIEEGTYKLIWDFHHIIMDGWCLGVIVNEFFNIYNSLQDNKKISLEEVEPYSNYIHWLQEQDKEESINYWKNVLEDYGQQATIPKLAKRHRFNDFLRNEVKFSLDEDLTKRLTELAINNQVTLSTVFQCLWGILLQRYNNTCDVVFGTVVAGRPSEIPGIEKMAGLFINTIPVRIKCDGEKGFDELIKDVQQNLLSSESYHYAPLSDIQSITSLKGGNLIDNLLAFENYPVKKDNASAKEHTTGFVIDDVEMIDQANYDFNIVVAPDKELLIRFIFNASVYDIRFVKSIERHLKEAIKSVLNNGAVKIKNINILTQEELYDILSINNTEEEYEQDKIIKELFEEEVEKTPDNIAVVHGNRKLSYRELNAQANKLAWLLNSKGVSKGSIIGVMTGNSIETIIGILGILKTGGVYLPIDSEYPKDRIQYMLEDSGARALLIQEKFNSVIDTLDHFQGYVINIDEIAEVNVDCANPKSENIIEDVAYVIYTSGSTGKPKGVMIKNKGIANLKKFFSTKFGVTDNDRVVQFASIAFDASIWEIFMTLLAGAQLYIVPRDVISNYSSFEGFLNKNEITIATLPPTYLANLRPNNIETIRKLIVAGSVNPISLFKKYGDKLEYINAYGPTETTICATVWSSKQDELCGNSVPIGRPISNTKVYIVNENKKIQPKMVVGELCVAGDSLAKGYLNRPELTAQKFVLNPLNDEIMYRTGDLARLLPNGDIEFIGRIDNQIKLRSFRIELSEIESLVLENDSIIEAFSQVRGDEEDSKYICLYFTAKTNIDIEELRKDLLKKLPNYMIPTYFVQLSKMPLTSNGKIDIKRLPSPITKSVSYKYDLPGSELEEKIAEIWRNILKNEKIGVNDNFFEIGGNSLLLMKLYARLEETYDEKIKITDIFNNPTISKLAEFIENHKRDKKAMETNNYYKTLEISQQYLTGNQVSKAYQSIRAQIKDNLLDKLRKISSRENNNVQHLLFAIYSFLLFKISNNQKANLQAIISDNKNIVPVSIDFKDISSFIDILKRACEEYQEEVCCTVQWNEDNRANEKTGNACYSLYYDGKLITHENDLPDIFDFTLGVTEKDTELDFVFTFNTGRLRKDKMKIVFEQYLALIKLLVEKESF